MWDPLCKLSNNDGAFTCPTAILPDVRTLIQTVMVDVTTAVGPAGKLIGLWCGCLGWKEDQPKSRLASVRKLNFH